MVHIKGCFRMFLCVQQSKKNSYKNTTSHGDLQSVAILASFDTHNHIKCWSILLKRPPTQWRN